MKSMTCLRLYIGGDCESIMADKKDGLLRVGAY